MEIREATPDDAQTVNAELLEPGFRETTAVDPEFSELDEAGVADAGLDRWLDTEDRVAFLAEHDGTFAGYIAGIRNDSPPIYTRGDRTHVDGLYVKPAFRREGVASALFDRIEAWARERDCEYLGVSAHVDNEAAVEMYDDAFERKYVSYRRRIRDE
ncbi:GNAT family N-acetyltransferase [Halobacterium wangiae]|uniref:GNAT family N-acetyltransferase n=1 Tax=Halobacterium wangiae TaxID=2902623 RepID=UPI001E42BDE6|nr:GNAT family N-acetyltransferase [Halobacterium wangiae]